MMTSLSAVDVKPLHITLSELWQDTLENIPHSQYIMRTFVKAIQDKWHQVNDRTQINTLEHPRAIVVIQSLPVETSSIIRAPGWKAKLYRIIGDFTSNRKWLEKGYHHKLDYQMQSIRCEEQVEHIGLTGYEYQLWAAMVYIRLTDILYLGKLHYIDLTRVSPGDHDAPRL